MPITPVTRTPTTWQTLTTTLQEKWLNENDAQDIVTKGTPTVFWMYRNAVRREPLPYQLMVRVEDSFNVPGDAYEYDDTVAMGTFSGPRAGYEYVRQYSWPLQLTHQEELEHSSPEALISYVDEKMHKLIVGASLRIAQDLVAGSYTNSKRMTGWEQMLYAARPESSIYSGTTIVQDYNVWKLRQANNTYAAISRAAFTADETTGTGWEAPSIDYRNDPTNIIQLSPYAPHGPDAGLIGLQMLYSACCYGTERPNFMVSTRAPWNRYHNAVQGKALVYKTADAYTGGELMYSALSYNGIPWFHDEYVKTWNVANATQTITALNNVYMLNLNHLRWMIDPREDFLVTPARTPVDQHVSVRHLKLRTQQVMMNPRYSGRAYNVPE